ncbi:sigma-70 family RNA polymerase sigma factor [Celeribacter sp.]|uniref:sigma-70 family RNA polymerase sigma factor n=1 Tax=Celeribacter sp. TaxID=1890673 RepID=UPI003A959514
MTEAKEGCKEDNAPPPRDRVEELIARVSLGERAALSELYDLTSAKLFAVSLRVLGERQSAEDAMHDTYVKIWKNAGRYRVTGHSPMTWLITIARNTAIDRLRARRNHAHVGDYEDTLAAPSQTPEQATIIASDARRIVACLDTLPEDRRAAITGAYLDGQSYAELAEAAKVPLNTMRTWLRRGLSALRECMDG